MTENQVDMFAGVGLGKYAGKDIPESLQDFGNDNGVYLEAVELQNWGPFNGLMEIPLLGLPGLLIGENGTGKTSLMDAILTLLVSKGLRYNSASDSKKTTKVEERTLMEYVLGFSGSSITGEEEGNRKRTWFLRKTGETSIVLLRFRSGMDMVSIANVFLAEEGKKDPKRFYVYANRPLFIRSDFEASSAGDFDAYRMAVGQKKGVTATTDRAKYFAFVRENLGLPDDSAMRLLRNLSFTKSLDRPDEFIREHMLRAGSDLWGAYDGMVSAIAEMQEVGNRLLQEEKKCRMLESMKPSLENAVSLEREVSLWVGLQPKVQPFVFRLAAPAAERETKALEEKQASLKKKAEKLYAVKESIAASRVRLEDKRDGVAGGSVVAKKAELASLEAEKGRRVQLRSQFVGIAKALGLRTDIDTEYTFREVADAIGNRKENISAAYRKAYADRQQAEAEMNVVADGNRSLEAQKRRLEKDRTAIDGRLVAARDEVCAAIGVDPETMPFLGSLLSVKEGEEAWRPALEYRMRRESLSFLVDPGLVPKVSAFLDKRFARSGIRVRYLAMRPYKAKPDMAEGKALWTKLSVRQGTPFTAWAEEYVRAVATDRCCDTPEEFATCYPAILPSGQRHINKVVHELDGTADITDPRNFVMGGSFAERMKALEQELAVSQEKVSATRKAFVEANKAFVAVQEEKAVLDKTPVVPSFEAIDTEALDAPIADCMEAIRVLESDSRLEKIKAQLEELEARKQKADDDLKAVLEEADGTTAALGYITRQAGIYKDMLDTVSFTEEEETYLSAMYDKYRPDAKEPKFASIMDTVPKIQSRVTRKVNELSPALEQARRELEGRQRAYLDEFRGRRNELEPGLSMADAWLAELGHVRDEYVPAAKEAYDKVVDYQNVSAVRSFVIAADTGYKIRKVVEDINRVLQQVPYSQDDTGTFLQVNCLPCRDGDVVALRRIMAKIQQSVRTEDISSVKPEEMAAITEATGELSRFLEGRKGRFRKDAYSPDNLFDQRNWYTFPVSVCREVEMGNGEKEIIHVKELDKVNKQSGGEGEKFAYFILVACFAIWMHILDKDYAGRTFRFLMIDEIGNKLSPSNLRDVLSLFRLLRVQTVTILPEGDKISEYDGFVGNIVQADWLDKEIRSSFLDTLSLTSYIEQNRARTGELLRQGKEILQKKATLDKGADVWSITPAYRSGSL